MKLETNSKPRIFIIFSFLLSFILGYFILFIRKMHEKSSIKVLYPINKFSRKSYKKNIKDLLNTLIYIFSNKPIFLVA